jgi:TonB family protein
MAPIPKETEAPVAAPTSSAPHIKSPSESPTRTQPVALEIPVTVNGARTVDGSDKRVPFSESTQTVLVLPHGAVVRIATPLSSGQLVFLTNEKTKKEVVCQVVKSKSTGSAAAYVELQFTEPSPGFWGLQVPAVAPAAHPVHRPVAAVPSGVTKAVTPTPTVAKPSLAPQPASSAAPSVPVTKHVVPVVPPAPVHQAPVVANSEPVSHPHIAQESSSQSPVSSSLSSHTAEPVKPVAPRENQIKLPEAVSPAPTVTAPPDGPPHPIPAPPLRNYSKEINALFAGTQTPVEPAPQPSTTPTAAAPTTDDLKLQAARLQAQLSSMLFTETPAPSKNVATPADSKTEPLAAVTSKKVVEFSQPGVKAVAPAETKPVMASTKYGPSSLDEEVKVPSWLAPLSQNSQSISAEPAQSPAEPASQAVSVNSEESFDALVAEAPKRSETAVFGGHLLGEAASAGTPAKGSKTGLVIGLAAAAVVVLAAGGWYYHQNSSAAVAASSARATSIPEASASAPTTALATPAASSTVTEEAHSAPVIPSKPTKHSAAGPAVAAPAPAPEHTNATAAAKTTEPLQAPPTAALGDVHLSAPVVNRSTQSPQVGDAVPAIEANAVPGGSDPFAVAGRHTPPAAPLPIGGDVKPARLIKSVPPEYPEMAKTQHVSGKVQIDALVDASGNVASVKILSGPMLLRKAALDAVKQWRYTPARLDDQPTSMHLTVTVEFRGQ